MDTFRPVALDVLQCLIFSLYIILLKLHDVIIIIIKLKIKEKSQ